MIVLKSSNIAERHHPSERCTPPLFFIAECETLITKFPYIDLHRLARFSLTPLSLITLLNYYLPLVIHKYPLLFLFLHCCTHHPLPSFAFIPYRLPHSFNLPTRISCCFVPAAFVHASSYASMPALLTCWLESYNVIMPNLYLAVAMIYSRALSQSMQIMHSIIQCSCSSVW